MKTAARLLTPLPIGRAAVLLFSAALLLLLGVAPYPLLRAGLDRLARDGSLELFTPALASFLQSLLLAGGLLLFAAVLAILIRPRLAARAAAFPARLAADGRAFCASAAALRLPAFEWGGLALVLAAGIWVRLVLLRAPMEYDESYTWVAFASRSFTAILTDYHLPNNHVFHTILVRLSALLFAPLTGGAGFEPWALRLPAFLAGILMIPAAWLAGRALFSRGAGLLAAALVSAWPYLVEYGARARGYTLTGLFTLLLFALIPTLLTRRSSFAWLLAALLSALGLFTVPVMLYPVGIFFTLLLLSALRGRHQPAWTTPAFLAALAGCGLAIGLLTLVFYLPLLAVSGPASLFANPFVRAYAWGDWLALLPVWGRGIIGSWVSHVPVWIWLPVLLCIFIPARQPRRAGSGPVHPLWAVLLFFALALPLQRPELQAKAFFDIVPLLLLASAAGLANLINLPLRRGTGINTNPNIPQPRPVPATNSSLITHYSSLITSFALFALSCWSLLQARPNLPYLVQEIKPAVQSAAEYVASRIQPGDTVLVAFPFDPQVWYYGNRSGIPLEIFKGETFSRAWVLAIKPLAEVLQERGPLDRPLRVQDCRREAIVKDIPIYLCQRQP